MRGSKYHTTHQCVVVAFEAGGQAGGLASPYGSMVSAGLSAAPLARPLPGQQG